MSCTLSNIPGYELANSSLSYKKNYEKLKQKLAKLLGEKEASRFLKDPHVALYASREAFPDAIRELSYTAFLPPYSIYSYEDATLYIALDGVEKKGFLARLIAEAGFFAHLEKTSIKIQTKKVSSWIYDDFSKSNVAATIREHFDSPFLRSQGRDHLFYRFLQHIDGLYQSEFSKTDNSKRPLNRLVDMAIENMRHPLGEPKAPPSHKIKITRHQSAMPLNAVVRIAPYELPTVRVLFAGAHASRIQGFPFYDKLTLMPPSRIPGLPSAFAQNVDDSVTFSPYDGYHFLSNLSLRPLARLNPRMIQDPKRSRLNIIRNCITDFPYKEIDFAAIVPYLSRPIGKTGEITRVEVSKRSDWAVIELTLEGHTGKIRALHSLWAMQATRLKTNTQYDIELSFWAQSVRATEEKEKRTRPSSDTSFPFVTLKAKYQKVEKTYSVAGIDFVTMKCSTKLGPLLITIPKRYLPQEPFNRGDKLSFDGFFIVGEFIEDLHDLTLHAMLFRTENPLAAKRYFCTLPLRTAGTPEFFRAITMKPRSAYFRRLRRGLLERAANLNLAPALLLAATSTLFGPELFEESGIKATHRIAKAAVQSYLPALRFLALTKAGDDFVPEDIKIELLRILASEFDDPKAQLAYYKANQTFPLRQGESIEGIAETAWLVQSAAHGVAEANFLLAKAHALGLGITQSLEIAQIVLEGALHNGIDPASYWLAGFSRFHENFFTMPEHEKEASFKSFAATGIPYALVLLGLYYQYGDSDNPKARLLAYSLFRETEKTLHDYEAKRLREKLEKHLSFEERSQLQLFELWKELGINKPADSVSIKKIATPLLPAPLLFHVAFLQALDSSYKEEPTEKIRQLISFIVDNSQPVHLKSEKEGEGKPKSSNVLYGYGLPEGPLNFDRSMLLYAKGDPEDYRSAPWNMPSVYPIFHGGSPVTLYLTGASEESSYDCGVLEVTPFSEAAGPARKFRAFDPLWPALKRSYRTNVCYRGTLYGLVQSVKFGKSPYEAMPIDVIEHIQKIRSQHAEIENIVGVTAEDAEQALYRIDSTIRSVERDYTEVFSVSFARITVDAFIGRNFGSALFTLFIPETLLSKKVLRVGDRVNALFELTVLIEGQTLPSKAMLN